MGKITYRKHYNKKSFLLSLGKITEQDKILTKNVQKFTRE